MAIVIIPLHTPPADEPNKCVKGECVNDGFVGLGVCLASFVQVAGHEDMCLLMWLTVEEELMLLH